MLENYISEVLCNCETAHELHSEVTNLTQYIESVVEDILEDQSWHEEFKKIGVKN